MNLMDNKGAKIKRNKRIYKKRKTTFQKVVTVTATLLFFFVLGFVGYSVGKPVTDYLRGLSDKKNQETSQITSQAVTEPSVTTAGMTETQITSETTAPQDVPEISQLPNQQTPQKTITLYAESLISEQALREAVNSAKEKGADAVCVELVQNGGAVYFKTLNQTAAKHKAIYGEALPLETIASVISSSGLKARAELSLLTDHIVSMGDRDYSYTFENSETIWLDNRLERGGRAWLSPFKSASREYLRSIVSEITSAGISTVVIKDLEFPPFRTSDLNYVGEIVKSPERYKALIDFLNAAGQNAVAEIPMAQAAAGKCEVFVPSELGSRRILAVFDAESVNEKLVCADGTEINLEGKSPAEKAGLLAQMLVNKTSDTGCIIIPAIKSEGLSDEEINAAAKAFANLGLNEIWIK